MDIHRSRFVPYPPSTINALAFSHIPSEDEVEDPNCLRLAIGRASGDIEIWNPANGAWLQEKVFSGGKDRSVEGLVWTQEPDEEDGNGNTLRGRLRLFSIGYSSNVTEWDLVKGVPIRHSDGNHSEIWCFSAQPRWDTTKKNKQKQDTAMQQNLVAGCADGTVVLLSTADDGLRFDKFLSRPPAKRARVLSVVYQDRHTVLAGFDDSMIRVFDTRGNQVIRNISLGSGPPGGPKDILVWKIKCLPNGDFVSGDSTGDLRFYDGKNYSQVQRVSGHEADVLDLSVSRDGNQVFSGGMDRRTCVYSCSKKSGALRKHGAGSWRKVSHKRYHDHDVKALAAYDGKKLSVIVSGGIDTQPIVVPIREFGRQLSRSLPSLPRQPPLVSAPGSRLMISWWNSELRVWRVKKGQNAIDRPKVVARLALRGDENITSATISKDGSLLAAATASGVKVFHLSSSKPSSGAGLSIRKLETHSMPGAKLVKFSAGGKWLALVTHSDQVMLARTVRPVAESERPHILLHLLQLHRLERPSPHDDPLNGPWGLYARSINHVEFSIDGNALAVADISGYIDTWVIEGHEDPTAPEVDVDDAESAMSVDDGSEEEEVSPRERVTIVGQRWVRNPHGHLLPRVDSMPLLLSFEPTGEEKSRPQPNGNPAVHTTRNNPHLHSHEIIAPEQTLLVVTARHSIYEFEVLAGRLSEWSRRNPPSSYPQQFRLLDNPAKGCLWDIAEGKKRLWLYGEKWLFMFDLSRDLPLTEVTSNECPPSSKKRKRHINFGTQSGSGAGDSIPEREAPVTKIRKLATNEVGELVEDTLAELNPENGGAYEQDFSESENALTRIRRGPLNGETEGATNGHQLINGDASDHDAYPTSRGQAPGRNAGKTTSRESWWQTFKYRPILGIVAIGEEKQPLEVVLVERPSWDLELPSRFVGNHE